MADIRIDQKVVWDAVPGAVQYRVVAKAGTTVIFSREQTEIEVLASAFLAAQPHGTYTVLVAATDGAGYGVDAFIVVNYVALPAPSGLAVV